MQLVGNQECLFIRALEAGVPQTGLDCARPKSGSHTPDFGRDRDIRRSWSAPARSQQPGLPRRDHRSDRSRSALGTASE